MKIQRKYLKEASEPKGKAVSKLLAFCDKINKEFDEKLETNNSDVIAEEIVKNTSEEEKDTE